MNYFIFNNQESSEQRWGTTHGHSIVINFVVTIVFMVLILVVSQDTPT